MKIIEINEQEKEMKISENYLFIYDTKKLILNSGN